jgi:hypothetical protein
MRKNMNADKLLKIAKLLDEKNHFALADKVDRIADDYTRRNNQFYYNPNAGETWYDRLGRVFSGNATMYDHPGLVQILKQNDKMPEYFRERNRKLRNNQNPQQNQQQQPQKQDPLLISTTPDQFVNNLFEYGKKFGLSNFTQTMDLYANQGGTLNGQPINQNPQALGLYDQVKNYSGNLTPQQILAMLSGSGQ